MASSFLSPRLSPPQPRGSRRNDKKSAEGRSKLGTVSVIFREAQFVREVRLLP